MTSHSPARPLTATSGRKRSGNLTATSGRKRSDNLTDAAGKEAATVGAAAHQAGCENTRSRLSGLLHTNVLGRTMYLVGHSATAL